MNTKLSKIALATALCLTGAVALAQAQPAAMPAPTPVQPAGEMGRVISTTPVIQQFAVPTQVCGTQQIAVQQPKSGAGGLMGAIAGGVVGNAVGAGSGRALATMIGVMGGAAMGDNIEGAPPAQVQNVQNCTTQTNYENRTVGYNVVYEYGGRQYNVQMPQAPGQFIALQVTPVGAATAQPPVQQQPIYQQAPQQQVAAPQPIIYAPAPVVVAAPYPYPYIYPSISFGFGFGGGYRHGRGHWR
jgi:uncharacterized protein YcfJ